MALLVASILIMLVGILGVIVPIVPGLVLTWLGVFIYAFFTDFAKISWEMLAILGGIVAFSFLVDFLANLWGVKRFGASSFGMLGAVIGGFVGILFGGFFGLILGPFIGAFVFEYLKNGSFEKSLEIGTGTFVGFLAGTFIKFILGIVMLGLFIFWVI